ncbi:hypothetical protein B0533_13320 [Sedimentibacter sp. SX930]|nr:hypothetical protein B0533_13320 [Sedimentibacter sp. SX930]
MLRNNPSKAVWRGKSVQIRVRKPAETTLAGKNVRGQHEIARQNHFGGEFRHEREQQNTERGGLIGGSPFRSL